MKQLLLVGLGGGIGAIARHQLGQWIMHRTPEWQFPPGIFVVNILGCLAAGLLWGAIERWAILSPDTRLFAFTGILGGFTTFSAFGLDTILLIRKGAFAVAAANVALSVFCGLLVLWLAIKVLEPGHAPTDYFLAP